MLWIIFVQLIEKNPLKYTCVCVFFSHLAQGAHQLRRVMRVVESRGSRGFRKVSCLSYTTQKMLSMDSNVGLFYELLKSF